MSPNSNQPVEKGIETTTQQYPKLTIAQAERLYAALLERKAIVDANRPVQSRLIGLLATDTRDATIETVDAWRMLADDLHAQVDSLLIYADGYLQQLKKNHPDASDVKMTERYLANCREQFITPFEQALLA